MEEICWWYLRNCRQRRCCRPHHSSQSGWWHQLHKIHLRGGRGQKVAFLDTLVIRWEDGTIKLLVYRKATHTDQYLNFNSHHPLHQKLGVVRTLLDRKEKIVSEDHDKEEEEKKIKTARHRCGYPDWCIDRVKTQKCLPKEAGTYKRDPNCKSKGMVVVPYVEGVSEKVARILKTYNISSAIKPNSTLRNLLVHPKDKREPRNWCGIFHPMQKLRSYLCRRNWKEVCKRVDEHRAEVKKVASNNSYQGHQESVTINSAQFCYRPCCAQQPCHQLRRG